VLLLSDSDQGFAGVDIRARLQAPSRLAPFIGLGMFNGASRGEIDATNDRTDNDDDGIVDEPGEKDWTLDAYTIAAYPEFGAHFWLNGSGRLTIYTRYFVTSEGRDRDQWLLGGQATIFAR